MRGSLKHSLPHFSFGALVLLCCLSIASPVQAQDTVTGAFAGIVSNNQTIEPIEGALVEIVNQQTGISITRRTDIRGSFYQGLLAPGVYTIRVSATNFTPREVEQRLFITRADEVVPVPVALDPLANTAPTTSVAPPAGASQTVEDTDIRARINTTDARRDGGFSEEEIATLPLGATTFVRSFDELALLLPGIAPPPQTAGRVAGPGVGSGVGTSGQFAVNGLRSRANNFTVDGSDNNDEDIGVRRQGFVALIPQPIESVEGYQVTTLLAPAQYGRNIGAQVNAVSKSGGSRTHGTLYGFFNSSQLNARNFFDSTNGNQTTALRAGDKPVLLGGRAATVTNGSGGEDSLTFGMGGFTLGGAVIAPKNPESKRGLFYFISAEGQLFRAVEEANFSVPTIAERGLFGSGATGLSRNPFGGAAMPSFPTTVSGDAVFSLYPFPNNPNGIYGANTLTQTLPADGQGKILSAKTDTNFTIGGKPQSFVARYNYTDDFRDIPTTGAAIFSTLRPQVRTQNFSTFLNSELSSPQASVQIFNQVRASYGRTRLRFDERRDTQFLRPSRLASALRPEDQGFLLNAPLFVNDTLPSSNNVLYDRFFNFSVEDILGPVGQVVIAGFSPIGVDVFNFPQRRVNNTYQLADTLTVKLNRHNLTFGADVRRTELNSELPRNARPLIVFGGAPRLITNASGQSELRGFFNPVDLAAASAPSGVFQTVTPGVDSAINLRYYQYNFFAQDEWRVRPNLSLSFGLRYEYNTPPGETRRRIEDTFDAASLNLVPGLRRFLDNRTSIFDPDRNNFAPRVGFAYSPRLFGVERLTVFRAGYGIFYDQALGAVVSQSRNVFPNFLTLNFAGGTPNQIGVGFQITDPSAAFFPCPDGGGSTRFVSVTRAGTLNTLDPATPLSCLVAINSAFPGGFGFTLPERRLEMPTAQHYAFTFEQQLTRTFTVSAAYVGTQGRHLLRLTTPNLGANALLIPTRIDVVSDQPNVSGVAISPGARINSGGAITGGRPVSGAGAVQIYEASANSRYDALQLQVRGRLREALRYQAAYTFSKVTDDVSDIFDVAGASALPQNSLTRAGERAPSNFDVRHRFSYNFIYDLPTPENRSGFSRALLGDWQVAATGRVRSGQPFTVNSIFDVNLDGNLTDRLDTTEGLEITGDRRQPLRLTATDATTLLAPIGQDGRIRRNSFRAGNVVELDLALVKNFRLSGRQNLLLRTEFFNFINRSNFGVPVRFLGAVGFGQAVETITPARRIQFALKYSF